MILTLTKYCSGLTCILLGGNVRRGFGHPGVVAWARGQGPRHRELLEQVLEVLTTAQAEGLEEVDEVEEGELRGVGDGVGAVVARPTPQRHATSPRPVAVREAERQAAGAEPGGRAAPGDVVQHGVARGRFLHLVLHLAEGAGSPALFGRRPRVVHRDHSDRGGTAILIFLLLEKKRNFLFFIIHLKHIFIITDHSDRGGTSILIFLLLEKKRKEKTHNYSHKTHEIHSEIIRTGVVPRSLFSCC